jgi:hypothetical protein
MTTIKSSPNFLAALAALAGDTPPSSFADQIECYQGLDYLKTMYNIAAPQEDFKRWVVELFIPMLKRDMIHDIKQAQGDLPMCSSPECRCCQDTRNQKDHLVWTDVTAKVARLINDPSTTESKEIMGKYAVLVLEKICTHLMYD